MNDHPHFDVEFAHGSDVGRVREDNEDALVVDVTLRIAVLADGMGGHAAGEVASAIAVKSLHHALAKRLASPQDWSSVQAEDWQAWLREDVARAHEDVLAEAERNPLCAGMGTTVVAACWLQQTLLIAHVGDSRAYRLRRGELQRLTRDHSLVEQEVALGLLDPAAAQASTRRGILTRALGVQLEPGADVTVEDLQDQDLLLLCSDGLTDALDDDAIDELLSRPVPLGQRVRELIDAANGRGGLDNVSVVLARCHLDHDFPELESDVAEEGGEPASSPEGGMRTERAREPWWRRISFLFGRT